MTTNHFIVRCRHQRLAKDIFFEQRGVRPAKVMLDLLDKMMLGRFKNGGTIELKLDGMLQVRSAIYCRFWRIIDAEMWQTPEQMRKATDCLYKKWSSMAKGVDWGVSKINSTDVMPLTGVTVEKLKTKMEPIPDDRRNPWRPGIELFINDKRIGRADDVEMEIVPPRILPDISLSIKPPYRRRINDIVFIDEAWRKSIACNPPEPKEDWGKGDD